jgi:ribonuclease HII
MDEFLQLLAAYDEAVDQIEFCAQRGYGTTEAEHLKDQARQALISYVSRKQWETLDEKEGAGGF